MSFIANKPVGIFFEHPIEFNPLVSELASRDIPLTLVNPQHHDYAPRTNELEYSLIYNDISTPTTFPRNVRTVDQLITFTKHLELNDLRLAQGRIINGSVALETFTNRARQLSVFSSLGIPFPKTRIVNSLDKLISILPEFKFPVLIKPNDAWKQLPVLRFDSLSDLIDAVVKDKVPFTDDLLLVQEYHQPKNNHIVRVDTLNGRVLGAQRIFSIREPLQVWSAQYRTEHFQPSEQIENAVESIVRAARVDIGTVEYFTDQNTNEIYFYSIRPYSGSRSSTDAERKLNTIADYFEHRLSKIREIELAL